MTYNDHDCKDCNKKKLEEITDKDIMNEIKAYRKEKKSRGKVIQEHLENLQYLNEKDFSRYDQ